MEFAGVGQSSISVGPSLRVSLTSLSSASNRHLQKDVGAISTPNQMVVAMYAITGSDEDIHDSIRLIENAIDAKF